jgi:hypothetical protein
MDEIAARFDSSLTPCAIVNPQQADSVHCNGVKLDWSPSVSAYYYAYPTSPTMEFLTPGSDYLFTVHGNGAVPSVIDTITFPSLEPYFTSPANGATVSRLTDLDLAWADSGAGTVGIFMGPSQDGAVTDTMLFTEVDNNGTYTIASTQMGSFIPGEYGIILIHQNREPITAPGYNSETSFIAGRVINAIIITLQ